MNEWDKARAMIHRRQVAALVLSIDWAETNARLAALRAEVDAAEAAYLEKVRKNNAERVATGCPQWVQAEVRT